MQEVSKIACVNAAGFVQEFRIVWQSRTIDLTRYNIPDGTEVWVEVHAILGKTKQASKHVRFSRNSSAAATYRTTGTTLFFNIGLED